MGKVRAGEVDIGEICTHKPRVPEARLREGRHPKGRAVEICACEGSHRRDHQHQDTAGVGREQHKPHAR